ncbi:MAG: DUF6768 family protein [Ekhidna sp.]
MKQNENIDELIKEALTDDEQVLFNSFEEQNVLQKFGGLFQGKMKWLNTLTFIIQFVMTVFAFYFGYRFFTAVDTIQMIQFGAGVMLLMIAISMLKLFHIMEMNKNATIREIKRMELQLSLLASKLKD